MGRRRAAGNFCWGWLVKREQTYSIVNTDVTVRVKDVIVIVSDGLVVDVVFKDNLTPATHHTLLSQTNEL